jgi:hypothetical protein
MHLFARLGILSRHYRQEGDDAPRTRNRGGCGVPDGQMWKKVWPARTLRICCGIVRVPPRLLRHRLADQKLSSKKNDWAALRR